MTGPTVPQHILTEMAVSLRAQERGIGQTLRAREIEAVARWIESWTPADAVAEYRAARARDAFMGEPDPQEDDDE